MQLLKLDFAGIVTKQYLFTLSIYFDYSLQTLYEINHL